MRLSSLFLVVLLGLVMVSRAESAGAQSASESNRKIVNRVVPTYPAMARNMNLRGTVKLEAVVLANGSVKSIQVKGGNPLLVQAALPAALQCKWTKSDHDSTETVEFRFTP
jgi:TonB family protein